jgi:LuxR family maltose regulon positive regulatory protein
LDTLERENLFLVPLDDERGWYRYHHLFSDLLKLLLEQTYPGLATDLHRRASGWYAAQGLIPEALAHALAAGDMELAARLVAANMLALVERAELAPILLHMDAAPREQREAQPWLGVAHAWALAYSGQLERAEAALALAETRLETLAIGERERIAGHIAAVRAYAAWVHGDRDRAVTLAENAEQLLPPAEIAVRALNLSTLGNALNQYDATPRSVAVLEQSILLARQAGLSHVYMLAATALVYAFNMLGELRKAHSVCLEALEVAETYQQRSGAPLPAVASAYAELSVILADRGEIDQAIQSARKGLALSEQWGQIDTTQICLLALANGLSLAGDAEAAMHVLRRARLNAQKVSPWFVQVVDEIELRVCLDANETNQTGKNWEKFPVSLLADCLIKKNRSAEAMALLERAGPADAQSLEAMRQGIIRSLALFLKNDEAGALVVLKPILVWAEAEQYLAIFIREGPLMEKLLRRALAKSICPEFVRRLLAVFEARRKPQPVPAAEALIEPLSERELEILSLLDGPLSTPEIAAKLVVSANTVRTHIKNIYGKLSVHGRSGAVRRAQELGLVV